MNKRIILTLGLASILSSNVYASQASTASLNLSSQGVSEIVRGSSHIIEAGGQLSIAAIKTVGDFTYITLKAAHNTSTVVLKVTRVVAAQAMVATGSMVETITIGSGDLIVASGRVLAFLPNHIGKELLGNEKI